MNQFGWLFFGFGSIFVFVFAANTDPMAMFAFRGELQHAKGVVSDCEESGFSEGGSENTPGTPVFRINYEFEYENEKYEGASFAKGKKLNSGVTVSIEFPEGRPERSRIKGMRTAAVSSFALLVLIFPTLGFFFWVFGFRSGWRTLGLLKHGEYTTGVLKSQEPTSTKINDRTVMKLTFGFTAESGEEYEAIAKTHQPEKLQDDPHEPLLYDPMNPARSTLLDHLPGAPQVNTEGQIKSGSPVTSLLCLLTPSISVASICIFIYFRCFK